MKKVVFIKVKGSRSEGSFLLKIRDITFFEEVSGGGRVFFLRKGFRRYAVNLSK